VKTTFLLSITLIVLTSTSGLSQTRKIIGKVIEADSQKPLKNVRVVSTASKDTSFTNYMGFFELTIDSTKAEDITLSHVGFISMNTIIPTGNRLKFELKKKYWILKGIRADYHAGSINSDPHQSAPTASISVATERDAMFPGGWENFYTELGKELMKDSGNFSGGRFEVTFTVDKNGVVSNISTEDSIRSTSTSIVVSYLKKMPPWIPARQRNEPVEQNFKLPIVTLPQGLNSIKIPLEFFEYINRHIRYPAAARRMKIEGLVIVQMELKKDGTIKEIIFLNKKDKTAILEQEVERVLRETPAAIREWIGEITYGYKFLTPISFGLDKAFKHTIQVKQGEAIIADEITVIGYGSTKKLEIGTK
jgi:TonB family protein